MIYQYGTKLYRVVNNRLKSYQVLHHEGDMVVIMNEDKDIYSLSPITLEQCYSLSRRMLLTDLIDSLTKQYSRHHNPNIKEDLDIAKKQLFELNKAYHLLNI